MTIREAVYSVVRNGPNEYAVSYANAWDANSAMGERVGYNDDQAQRVQATYILSNLSSWRGDEASLVRATLKKFAKVTLTKNDKAALDGQEKGASWRY